MRWARVLYIGVVALVVVWALVIERPRDEVTLRYSEDGRWIEVYDSRGELRGEYEPADGVYYWGMAEALELGAPIGLGCRGGRVGPNLSAWTDFRGTA